MITVQQLQDFAEAHVAERPNIENYFLVASDDKLAKLYKDTVNTGDSCSLVVLLPSHDPEIPDENNRRLSNRLFFMAIKKTDRKAGQKELLNAFKITQEEIKQLLIKLLELRDDPEGNCMFRRLDLDSIQIDPVADYVGSNGYEIGLDTLTEF